MAASFSHIFRSCQRVPRGPFPPPTMAGHRVFTSALPPALWAVLVLLHAPFARPHGLMVKPASRNAGGHDDPLAALLHGGSSMWFSQSCTIGCSSCNDTAAVGLFGGDLCPEDHSGNKTPTIMDPRLTTWNAQATYGGHVNFTRFHPWRRPGSTPGLDPCGVAGGSWTNHSFPAGGFGPETGYPQGYRGSLLPPTPNPPTWKAGGVAQVGWTSAANHGG